MSSCNLKLIFCIIKLDERIVDIDFDASQFNKYKRSNMTI